MCGHIQEIAGRLLDGVQPQGKMDLINDFAFPLPITVITEMLGVPTADDDKFRKWSTALIASGALSSETPHPDPGAAAAGAVCQQPGQGTAKGAQG